MGWRSQKRCIIRLHLQRDNFALMGADSPWGVPGTPPPLLLMDPAPVELEEDARLSADMEGGSPVGVGGG